MVGRSLRHFSSDQQNWLGEIRSTIPTVSFNPFQSRTMMETLGLLIALFNQIWLLSSRLVAIS